MAVLLETNHNMVNVEDILEIFHLNGAVRSGGGSTELHAEKYGIALRTSRGEQMFWDGFDSESDSHILLQQVLDRIESVEKPNAIIYTGSLFPPYETNHR